MKALILTLRCLLALVLGTLLVCGGWLLASHTLWGQDPPQLLGYAPFTVAGGEMEPALAEGDLAILRMGPECQPGDIAAFRNGEGALVLRRIVGTSEGQFVTQQEAFGQPDVALLDPANVEATCVTYLPGCGALAASLYSPVGLAVLAVLAILLLAVPAFLTRGGGPREAEDIFDEYAAPRPGRAPQSRRDVFEEYAEPRRRAPRYTGGGRPSRTPRPLPRQEPAREEPAYPLDSSQDFYPQEPPRSAPSGKIPPESLPKEGAPPRPATQGRYRARH